MAANINPYAHLGTSWSLWPAHTPTGRLNMVGGVRIIASNILSVLLTKQGEDYIHPEKGLAPDLFENLNDVSPQYWAYESKSEIIKWVQGIESISVDTNINHQDNRLEASIVFVPSNRPSTNTLTFGYYEYAGARYENGLDTFIADLSLNREPFFGLSR